VAESGAPEAEEAAETRFAEALRPRRILQCLEHLVAAVDPADWRILFENARFFECFPPPIDGDDTLPRRIAGFDAERARTRLGNGRVHRFEETVRLGAREVPLALSLRAVEGGLLLLEGQNIAKQKEAEYMLDSYSRMAERNARELQKEKERVEKLLLNIMPRSVYEEMTNFGTTTPQRFDSASIMMLDFVGFTDMAISRDPSALLSELNDMFSAFDRIVELFGCERIKTIGDAYMAVSGLPEPSPEHAHHIARVALRIRRYIRKRNASHPQKWHCRIGINTGPVIGSIVGVQKYVYDIFGPGVNLAARLEALSEPMEITLTADTWTLIRDDFLCTEREEVEVKGFGRQRLYTLEDEVPTRR